MSEHWIDAGPDTAAAGERRELDLDGVPVAIVAVAGQFYAFEDRCTHDGEPLADAEHEIDDQGRPVVICPRHGARFCLRSGDALSPPAYEPVQVFSTRLREGRLEVRAPEP